MSGNGEEFWRQTAAETHAKLISAREQLARATSDGHLRHSQIREELFRACELARSFIADDTCRHDGEKRSVLGQLDAAISRAGGGG